MAVTNTIFVGLEGMPRSGKSTTLSRVRADFQGSIDISGEIFFTDQFRETLDDPRGDIAVSRWFLEQESERLKKYVADPAMPVLLADRTYLSTLAYAYARAQLNSNPAEFEGLVDYFFENRSDFPGYKVIFLFDNHPKVTHERRSNKGAAENEYWMSEVFMGHYRNFYLHEAAKYTNAKIIVLDPDLSLQRIGDLVCDTLTRLLRPLISVVVCSHNDMAGLLTTLGSLKTQTMRSEEFEVVVVDNASQPHLEQAVQSFSRACPLIVRYVYEDRLGLSNAHNTGIQFSRSNLIAVTDSDNIADKEWLCELYQTFTEQPRALLVGGRVNNAVRGRLPWYFPEDLLEYFSPVLWPDTLSPVRAPYFIIGANMAFRKEAALSIGGYNPMLGRNGAKLLSCDDLEFTIKISKKFGADVSLIQPKAIVSHVTPVEMFHLKRLIPRAFWQGVSEFRLAQEVGQKYVYNKRPPILLLKSLLSALLFLVLLQVRKSIFFLFQAVAGYGYLYAQVAHPGA